MGLSNDKSEQENRFICETTDGDAGERKFCFENIGDVRSTIRAHFQNDRCLTLDFIRIAWVIGNVRIEVD